MRLRREGEVGQPGPVCALHHLGEVRIAVLEADDEAAELELRRGEGRTQQEGQDRQDGQSQPDPENDRALSLV